DRHHRRGQPHGRPGAAVHPLGGGRRQLHRGLDAADVRPAVQRVEGRRDAVPPLLGVAGGGGERRRVPRQGQPRHRPGAPRPAVLRDPRGREAHRRRDAGRRGRSLAALRHRQGHPDPASGWRRLGGGQQGGGFGGQQGGGFGGQQQGGGFGQPAGGQSDDPWATG